MFRNLILIGVGAALLFGGCQQQKPAVNIPDEITAADATVAKFVESIETENMDLLSKIMPHDSSMVNFWVTGEPIVGWHDLQAAITMQNDSLSNTDIETNDVKMHMSPAGDRAWATSQWILRANNPQNNPVVMNVLCTWVLEKMDIGWQIVHFHLSLKSAS